MGLGAVLRSRIRREAIGYPSRAGDPPPLDRALRRPTGDRARPASARAYQMLFVVQYARHDVAAAFAVGQKALLETRRRSWKRASTIREASAG